MSADASARIHKVLPASAAGLALALDATRTLLKAQGVAAQVQGRVLLLLEEAVVNVGMHGQERREGRQSLVVELTVFVSPTAVEILLRDNGRAFDPRGAPAAPRPANLDEAVPGGLGVHLMRTFARDLHYERTDGQNRLRMVVDRE